MKNNLSQNISQKQRMLQGLMYNPNGDAELQRERTRAKAMCQLFNRIYAMNNEVVGKITGEITQTFDIELLNKRADFQADGINANICSENREGGFTKGKISSIEETEVHEEENEIIRELLGRTGKNFEIVAPFWCDYGYNIEIGDNFFANHNTVILDCAKVIFGDNVFIGPNCGFYTAGHPLNAEQRRKGWEYARTITVGNDVWIGGGVNVMPGVTIGSGAVIGGGSVVTKDIPANVLAVGNPCRVVREIDEGDCNADLIL